MRTATPLPALSRFPATPAPGRTRRWRLSQAALRRAVGVLREWRRRSRGRRELAALDARTLRDIGATPGDVAAEINKPFWRA